MSKTADQVKGIRSSHEDTKPHVIMQDPDFENKNLSHDEFVAKYKKIADADRAAEKARRKSLEESSKEETPEVNEKEEKISSLREELAAIEKKLLKKPDDAKLMKEKNRVAAELDEAEEE